MRHGLSLRTLTLCIAVCIHMKEVHILHKIFIVHLSVCVLAHV